MKHKIALFVPSLRGGGAERVMVNLARGFAEEGHPVDLVLAKAEGPYLKDVPESVRIVDLDSPRVLQSLPGLVKYLRRERPHALLSALDHANLVALWAKRIANVNTRVVVSIHNTISIDFLKDRSLRSSLLPLLVKCMYPYSYAVTAVSSGVADDFSKLTGISRSFIKVIYNPVMSPELLLKAQEDVQHIWFDKGQPPVIIGVGRLTKQKDFKTLIKAFYLLRQKRDARLIILGEGEDRIELESLIDSLEIRNDVHLPGFVDNPHAYMAKAKAFVLSSLWEGLGNVLVEAIEMGIPVVSTNCPSGPREIADIYKNFEPIQASNPQLMADAICAALDKPSEAKTTNKTFYIDNVSVRYLELLGVV